MSSIDYKILGRAGAGSLIAEFLFREIGVDYEITFVDSKKYKLDGLSSAHPQGKIPTLVCPDRVLIFETLAIVNHITDRYNKLVPERRTPLYDRYWQFLSLMATSIYPAYHRQHHSLYYVKKESHSDLRAKAQKEQSAIYDYIEKELDSYICGDLLTAADFYLYMLLRWDLHKDALYKERPKLTAFSKMMRNKSSVVTVLDNQPKRKR
jgi:glutathione S-transferase